MFTISWVFHASLALSFLASSAEDVMPNQTSRQNLMKRKVF